MRRSHLWGHDKKLGVWGGGWGLKKEALCKNESEMSMQNGADTENPFGKIRRDSCSCLELVNDESMQRYTT